MQFQFTRKKLDQLLQLSGQSVISIYLPTEKSGAQQQQNPIRFANRIKEAREHLEKSGLSTHTLKEQLTAAEKMGEPDSEVWEHLKQGLALFVTESEIQVIKLPIPVKEYSVVTTHPFIKPLLPLITTNGKFYLLTLSLNDIKLYQANRTDIDKVFLGDIPRNMEAHFDMDDLDKHVFHGQGGGDEAIKADVSQFLNQIENGITDILEGEDAPLVVAGVEYLTSMYAKHNKYNNLVEATIDGNPEHTDKNTLHQSAWEIVQPIFKAREQAALDTYHELAGTGKTSHSVEEIVTAAFDGKVQTLFVLRGHEVWGEYVSDGREVLLHNERTSHSNDLLELATTQTLSNGGTVYSLKSEEMIEKAVIAAVYRY